MSIPHHSTHLPKLNRLLRTSASRTDIADELGLTPSAVTQLAATPAVQSALASSKQETAAADAQLDESYDRIERTLLTQLERTVPLLMRLVRLQMFSPKSMELRGEVGHSRVSLPRQLFYNSIYQWQSRTSSYSTKLIK